MTDLATAGGWQPALVTTGRIPMNARLIAPGGELGDDVIDIPSNVVLLRGDGRTVLIDAGSGSFAVEWPGSDADLLGALHAAGAAADEVDLVVVTHLDFDHC